VSAAARKFWWAVAWGDGSETRVDSARGFRDALIQACTQAGRWDAKAVKKFWTRGSDFIYMMRRVK
jgi:hypothetical protein